MSAKARHPPILLRTCLPSGSELYCLPLKQSEKNYGEHILSSF